MAQRIYLDKNWKFTEIFSDEMTKQPMADGQVVNIPHTVKEVPFHYFDESEYQMISCYQKNVPAPSQWMGKVVLLTFEAVGHETFVFVNGKLAGSHACGYTAFTLDVSDLLNYGGDNLITVRVNSMETVDQPPFGFVIDYMTFGGIYRDVYFEVKERAHIKDVFYKPALLEKISTDRRDAAQIKKMQVQTILRTDLYLSKEVKEYVKNEKAFVKQYLDGELLFNQPIAGLKDVDDCCLLELVSAPMKNKLWDIESPTLYEAKTEIVIDGVVVDENTTSVGFRSSEFTKDGYFLNGRKVKLRGLNRHQSYAYVGYAMPESMQRFDARILKEELALNAVRTSHYPQSHYFIDECDKLGLLVFTEMPGWQHIGGEEWKKKAVQNTADMVTQYRNHPSIILWGVRINESPDDDEFYAKTNETAYRLDPTRQTGGVRCIKNSSLLEDVYTYNDFVHSGDNEGCEPKKKVTGDDEMPYLISEYNGHMYPTKMFDWEEHRREHAIRHANVLDAVAAQENISGSFGWCMFDYNTHQDFGSGDRICYHGVMDMFRNPKLAASIYSAFSKDEPVLELSSSFDIGEHPACNRGATYIISNADSVRMYKNDMLIKEYTPDMSEYKNLKHGPILIDDYVGSAVEDGENFGPNQAKLVKYCLNSFAKYGMKITPGLVWAAARCILFYHMSFDGAVKLYNKYVGDWGGTAKEYRFEAIKDGKIVKTVTKVAMTKRHIEASASHTLLTEIHTYDVAALRIKMCDEFGNVLPFFNDPLRIEVEGPIELIGPDVVGFNGGYTGLYVKSLGEDGDAKVRLSAEGCEPVEINLQVEVMRK